MDKKTYQDNNYLYLQCMSIPELCEDQINGVLKGLQETIPADVIKQCRRVIVTGCGDSYLAARACIPAFTQFNKAFGNNFSYMRCIEVSRLVDFGAKPEYNASTLVVAVSASGGPRRISEALQRARHYGCKTLALTNNPESPAAQSAEYSLIVNTPAFPNATPGLRNYYASLTGLYALAAYMGEAKGLSKPGTLDGLMNAIREHTANYAKELERIDDQMFELAQQWQGFEKFESVADHIDYTSAYFIGAKFVEVSGIMCATMDSEDWCHVNFFAHDPQHMGTIVVCSKKDPNRSRIAETIHQMANVERPVLVIADGTPEEIGYEEREEEGVVHCQVPEAPAGYEFLAPMLNHLPGSLLASYHSALNGEPYFRGPDAPQRKIPSAIGTSNIEIV